MNERICLVIIFLTSFMHSHAQIVLSEEVDDTLSLQEVIVSSKSHIRHGVDGDVYVPNSLQKKHSANGLELLSAMNYPGIRVDLVNKDISYISSGEIQIRIDNVISSVDDLHNLDISRIKNIQFITMPGLKHGKNISIVVNVVCKSRNQGTSASITTMNALSSNYNDISASGKQVKGNAEWGLMYNLRTNNNEDVYTQTKLFYNNNEYHLPEYIYKKGHYNRSVYNSHNVSLPYNYLSPNNKHIVDCKLNGNFSGFPQRELEENVMTGDVLSTNITQNKSRQAIPSIKLNYIWNIDSLSALSVYWTGAYVKSKYNRGFKTAQSNDTYTVDGSKHSLHGELNYNRKLLPISSIDIGFHCDASNTSNIYTYGSINSYTMHNDGQFLFFEYKLATNKLQLKTGIGGERIHYRSGDSSYTFWAICPYIIVGYNFNDNYSLTYKFDRNSHSPSLADLTTFTRRDDIYEETIGNSKLKQYNSNSSELKMDADYGDTFLRLLLNYDYSANGIYTRCHQYDKDFDGYIFSKWNGAKTHKLQLSLYGEQYLFGKRIFVYAMPYMVRDIINTNEYAHTNTFFSIKAWLSVYLNNFSLDYDYDSPSEILESENLLRNTGTTNLCISYRKNNLSLKIGIRNLFNSKGVGTLEERLTTNATRSLETRNRAFGNMIYIGASWNIKSGKQHKSSSIVSTNTNLDGGIIK